MHKPVILFLTAAALVLPAGCVNRTTDVAQTVHPDVLSKAGLRHYWKWQVDLDPGETLTRLYRLDENVYCLTSANRLVALDAAKGWPKWSRRIAEPGKTVFAPCHAAKVVLTKNLPRMSEVVSGRDATVPKLFDAVLINTVTYALAFDRADGTQYRKIPFDFAANTAGSCNGTLFFVGSTKGWYYALRLREAVKLWWLFTDDMLIAPPVAWKDQVYVGSTDGRFYAARVDLKGRKTWQAKLSGPVSAPFHVDERGCFVGSEDNRVYAFDRITSQTIWRPVICEGPIRDAVQVGQRSVFVYARRDAMYAIDLANGKKRWTLPAGRQVLAATGGNVYVRDADNNVRVVDEILGRQRAILPLTGYALFAGNVDAPAIYIASRTGQVVCILPESAGPLTAEMLKTPPRGS